MKAVDYMQKKQEAIIVEKLHSMGFKKTEGLSYRELKRELAIEQFKQIDVDSSENEWF